MGRLDELGGYIRAEEHLRAAVDVVGADYAPKPGLRNSVPYQDADGKPTGLTNVEVNYVLERLEPAEPFAGNVAVFERLEEFWLANGYTVVTRTVDQPHRVLRVRHTDDFTVALKQGKAGNLWLTASSAPVKRTRVRPPPPALG